MNISKQCACKSSSSGPRMKVVRMNGEPYRLLFAKIACDECDQDWLPSDPETDDGEVMVEL